MTILEGKGIYIWKASQIAGGSLEAAVQACSLMGLKWVALKIGDAASTYFRSYSDMPAAVRAFKAAGIQVWGWHYIYGGVHFRSDGTWYVSGATPAQEAVFAAEQVVTLGLDGYIIDAEQQYKVYNQAARARAFVTALADRELPVPIGLSSYRYPALHPELPWREFLPICDFHMPQVYWQPGGAVSELNKSIAQLTALKQIPVVPAGRVYVGDGYPLPGPTPEEITAFLAEAVAKNCPAAFFWALDYLYLPTHGSVELRAARSKAIADFTCLRCNQPIRSLVRR
jgi:hypothetical protein